MFIWYETPIEIESCPKDIIITIKGGYQENRVSIFVQIEHMHKPDIHTILLFDKAGEAGRHIEDYLRDKHLMRLQKLVDGLPKTWTYFRSWAVHKAPELEPFLPLGPEIVLPPPSNS